MTKEDHEQFLGMMGEPTAEDLDRIKAALQKEKEEREADLANRA